MSLFLIALGFLAILSGMRSSGSLIFLGFCMITAGVLMTIYGDAGACSTLTGAEWIRACG